MRGKVRFAQKAYVSVGITPAYAGKRTMYNAIQALDTDHPRLCGEKGKT